MKKLLSSSLLSTALLAGALESASAGFDGWNAGAFVGIATSNAKSGNYYATGGAAFDFTEDADVVNLGATYTQFGLKAGWGTICDKTYWGVRARGAFNQGEATFDTRSFRANRFSFNGTGMKMRLRRDWEWGLGLLGGRLVADDVMVYGALEFGMQYRTVLFDVTDNTFAFQFKLGGLDKKKFSTPFATPALGVAVMFADRYSFNAEIGYDFALSRKTITHTHGNGTDKAQETLKGMNGLRCTIGVTYHF